MKVAHYTDIKAQKIEMDEAKDVSMRLLISEKDNAPEFAMRLFELGPYGHTPYHTHEWEHEVFIVEGKGKLVFGDEKKDHFFEKGYAVFVEPGAIHQFRNTEETSLKFLCLVPNRGQS